MMIFDGENQRQASEAEVAAFLASLPPATSPVPSEISDRQFFQQLAIMGLISEVEAEDAASAGILPPAILSLVDQLPAGERFTTRMKLKSATIFLRTDPLVETFGAMQGMIPEQIDDLWRAASVL